MKSGGHPPSIHEQMAYRGVSQGCQAASRPGRVSDKERRGYEASMVHGAAHAYSAQVMECEAQMEGEPWQGWDVDPRRLPA